MSIPEFHSGPKEAAAAYAKWLRTEDKAVGRDRLVLYVENYLDLFEDELANRGLDSDNFGKQFRAELARVLFTSH